MTRWLLGAFLTQSRPDERSHDEQKSYGIASKYRTGQHCLFTIFLLLFPCLPESSGALRCLIEELEDPLEEEVLYFPRRLPTAGS